MDKKTAEMELVKRIKEAQNAAGKVTGMRGRDLFDYRPEWFVEESNNGADKAEPSVVLRFAFALSS
jgi:hypothetical protein